MPQALRFDALVRSLYDAAVDPSAWGTALAGLAAASGADNIHLMAWDPAQPRPAFSLAPGMDEGIEAQYRAYYGAIDPRRLRVAGGEAGRWMACHHHFDARTVTRSEFFQDYLIPGGCRYLLGTRLLRHAGHDVFLGMHRAPRRRPFQADDLQRVERLTGYLQHAARLWLDTQDLRERAALGWDALDAAGLGVLSTDAAGHVRQANAYAQALMREGRVLRLAGGRLAAVSAAGAERLAAALCSVAASGAARSLRLDGRDAAMREACQLVVAPLACDGALAQRLQPATLMVLVRHTTHVRGPTVQQLMELHGLTPAEAWIARAIGAGRTLDDCAHEAGVTVHTVKRQLQSIFAKTGVQRQAELARQVAAMPVVRERSGRGPA